VKRKEKLVDSARKQALKNLVSYHKQAKQNPVLKNLGLPNPHMAQK